MNVSSGFLCVVWACKTMAVSMATQGKESMCMPLLRLHRGSYQQREDQKLVQPQRQLYQGLLRMVKCAPCAAAQEYREVRKRSSK